MMICSSWRGLAATAAPLTCTAVWTAGAAATRRVVAAMCCAAAACGPVRSCFCCILATSAENRAGPPGEDAGRRAGAEFVMDWVCERKSASDLVQSIHDSRYERQKIMMARCGLRVPCYILEGDPSSLRDAESAVKAVKTAAWETEIYSGASGNAPSASCRQRTIRICAPQQLTPIIQSRCRHMSDGRRWRGPTGGATAQSGSCAAPHAHACWQSGTPCMTHMRLAPMRAYGHAAACVDKSLSSVKLSPIPPCVVVLLVG